MPLKAAYSGYQFLHFCIVSNWKISIEHLDAAVNAKNHCCGFKNKFVKQRSYL